METETTNNKLPNVEPITGWLAFFLWVVVAGGRFVSICRNIYFLAFKIPYTFIPLFYIHKIVGYIVTVCFVVRLVRSYYKVQDNALPLTYTYFGFIFLGVLTDLLYWFLIGDSMRYPLKLSLNLLLGLLLFCYVKRSKQIQRRFEGIRSRLYLFDKVLIVVCFINFVGNYFFAEALNRDTVGMLNSRFYVADVVKFMNNQLQSDKGTDFIFKKAELEEDSIFFYYKYTQIEVDSIRKKCSVSVAKLLMLRELASYGNKEKIKAMDRIVDYGYYLNYIYWDKYERVAYQCNISPTEYNRARAMGADFRCDSLSWRRTLEQERSILPQPVMDYCQLLLVSVDYDARELEMVVQLPADGKMAKMEAPTLYQYLKLCRYDFAQNQLVQMAVIDKMNINFKFLRPDGTEFTTLEMSYRVFL